MATDCRNCFSFQGNGSPYSCLAVFPWTMRSLEILWGGSLQRDSSKEKWRNMLREWTGAITLGGTGEVIVKFMAPGPNGTPRQPIRVTIPKLKEVHFPVGAMSWALSHDNALSPLLVFSCRRLLFVIDLNAATGHGIQNHTRPAVSKLQGHGGAITSIATHPRNPSWICTTSEDFTARIYDISLPPSKNADDNPCWTPGYGPSKGGVPHGLRSSEEEGTGLGRCVVVLVGNKTGGHQAAVMSSAFHPTLPAIATCGVDRAIKIWRMQPRGEALVREDKPMFSTDRIHRAMVLSVAWLDETTLVTHSGPVLVHKEAPRDNEAGTLCVWSWYGLERFFPPGQSHDQNWLRGCVLVSMNPPPFGDDCSPPAGFSR
ncbi:WD40-repeat-containing domain protein [Amylostereum chailletii]|nr:WD40-repeat-containing domain protein [Amylostereum chailletii]